MGDGVVFGVGVSVPLGGVAGVLEGVDGGEDAQGGVVFAGSHVDEVEVGVGGGGFVQEPAPGGPVGGGDCGVTGEWVAMDH